MSDAYCDFMHRHLSIREREMRMLRDEYAFLQSCGGVTSEEMDYFRTSVLRFRNHPPITITIKDEPGKEPLDIPPPSSPLISLKSMLLDIITREQADNINKICRHVRPILDREGIRTFCRHHATHVRSSDQQRVMEVLQKEGIV